MATSLHSLASLLIEKGDFEAAEPLAREALAMHRSLLGDRHVDVTLDLLARALRATVGPGGRGVQRAVERLIALYEAWDRPEKASEDRALLDGN